jgi:urea transporter
MENVLFSVLLFGLIMLFVFVLNYITQQVDIDKISQYNKNKYHTWFRYFYCIFFLLYGLSDIFFEGDFLSGTIWVVISITILILNYKGKVFSNPSK